VEILLNQVKLETKLFLREKEEVLWGFLFPVFMMLLMGFLNKDSMITETLSYLDWFMPGMIVLAVMTTCIINVAIGIVGEREKGIYRRLFLTPLKRSTLIGAKIVNRYVIVLLQTVIIIAIGMIAFKVGIVGNYGLLFLVLTVGMFSLLALGFALASFIPSAGSAHWISMMVFFVLMFLGALFIPMEIMPDFLQPVAKALPSTCFADAIRGITISGAGIGVFWRELLILIGWFAGCSALAVKFFRWE
jgi:ABC-2 type transport system permease protein